MTPQTRLAYMLSDDGFNAVEDFVQATSALAISEPSSQEAADAYVAYTMRKKELLDYISDLEKRCRIPRQSRVVTLFANIQPPRNAAGEAKSWTPEAP